MKNIKLLLLICLGSMRGAWAAATVRARWAGDDAAVKCARDCKSKCEAYCSVRGGVAKHSCSGHVGSDDELYANCVCECVE